MSKANDDPQSAITKEEFNEGLSVAKADIVAVVCDLKVSMNKRLDGMNSRFDRIDKTLALIVEVLQIQDRQIPEHKAVGVARSRGQLK